ncbi:CPBP family glutamic-type intramembrane protease [Echinicola shivajiensis]|uniref:CPBP family glutamic-type intramembrane protease n=1 Tax=Echinicola shivajiensis TaxID=1035916 RepID=UPI001BFC2963|nr:CPBP family glutamic-type intramembrane protease [Echinicola shivajiensis]
MNCIYDWFSSNRMILLFFFLIILYSFFIVDPIAMYFGVNGFDVSFKNSSIERILGTLFFAPILEELIFRGYLSGYRKHYLFVVIQIVLFCMLYVQWILWILFFSALLIGAFFRERIIRRNNIFVSNKLFYISILFSSILFSLTHLKEINAETMENGLIMSITAFFPGALFFMFIRYKKGIIPAILVHFLLNFFVLFLNTFIY